MKLYRYEYLVTDEEGTVELVCREYLVQKETPKGYWISMSWSKKKWISKTARKRYAYPTKAEALNYFILKSQSHIARMNWRIEIVSAAVLLAKLTKEENIKQ